MSKLNFSAELKTRDGSVKALLELFKFKEGDMTIVYCPAIDLSAYGRNDKEAEHEFVEVFRMHMSHCLAKKTIAEDLKSHGWHIKGVKQKKIAAPTIEELLPINKTLQDIIYNKDFVKMSRPMEIPQFA